MKVHRPILLPRGETGEGATGLWSCRSALPGRLRPNSSYRHNPTAGNTPEASNIRRRHQSRTEPKEQTVSVATESAVKAMMEVAAAKATEMPIATKTAGSKRSDRIAAGHAPAAEPDHKWPPPPAAAAEAAATKMAAAPPKPPPPKPPPPPRANASVVVSPALASANAPSKNAIFGIIIFFIERPFSFNAMTVS